MKQLCLLFLLIVCFCSGCKTTDNENTYTQISQVKAREMMEEEGVIVLDAREQSEFDGGHIPGAVLLPVGTITEETASAVIPELDAVVLVYCRSGNRSKTASEKLVNLGYTNVYEFGGILSWPYEIES